MEDQDLAYRFNVSKSSVNQIFTKWINGLYFRTEKLIIFPEKETVRKISATGGSPQNDFSPLKGVYPLNF